LIREEKFLLGAEKPTIREAEQELRLANDSYWDGKLSQLTFYKSRGDEILDKYRPLYTELEKREKKLTEKQAEALMQVESNAMINMENTHKSLNTLFNEAWKFAKPEARTLLKQAADEFKSDFGKAIDKKTHQIKDPSAYSSALQGMINNLFQITGNMKTMPQIFTPVENFTKDKASDTLSNVAFNAYSKFGNKSPIVSVENPPYGQALARGEDLKGLIVKTREKFANRLMKEKGMTSSQARAAAERLVGVTWDTSHISMMRKQPGFGKEKLVKEAKEIAPFLKHVHINDNFGSTHTDLPPGMGSVPIKEIQEEFKKAGFIGKQIFEGGGWFQHFQTSPHPYVMESLGSPVYSMAMAPYWNQLTATYGSYFSFPSAYFPEQHFSMYGGGFSNLPQELGGQIPGKGARYSGKPME
jgi:hypothetical protein